MNIEALKSTNTARWKVMHTDPALGRTLDHFAERLTGELARARYQTVSEHTHVPWWVIAVIHLREASQSWAANLAQGDPWDRSSIHVPRHRGPFKSWEEAAIDALANCAPHAAKWTDWSAGGTLTLLEMYNGLGYAMHGAPSPYLWASTDQYRHGKYVSDGHYDPNAIDHQLGCAALLARMRLMDKSIEL